MRIDVRRDGVSQWMGNLDYALELLERGADEVHVWTPRYRLILYRNRQFDLKWMPTAS